MIRHIFIGPVFPGCTDERLSNVVDVLRTLPSIVPGIRKLSVEKTVAWCESKAIVLIAEFDSRADWERYMHEPGHLALGEKIKDAIDLPRMVVVQTGA
ncbi:Dabb family protein [Pseudomonas sp. LFM046]|uniref:Dabb family protein n=1 Tax=Pseudomonas sp. LFM046 TaxID=1608357 RepID=UPI0005CFBB4E|nr:Dabb family protein [Pseudomonas sp. LFM046]